MIVPARPSMSKTIMERFPSLFCPLVKTGVSMLTQHAVMLTQHVLKLALSVSIFPLHKALFTLVCVVVVMPY